MLSLFNSFITLISDRLVNPMIRHKRRTILAVVILVLVGYQFVNYQAPAELEGTLVATPEVELISAADIRLDGTFSAIGTIQAVSEAQLKAQAGGQVTAVYTEIGKTVKAGAILAQTENARESAALLQAQGSYEAAQAGSAQGDSGVRDAKNGLENAKNSAITTYKSTYTSASGVLLATIDQFFANPETTIPGVKISGADTSLLNTTRVRVQNSLALWQRNTVTVTKNDDLEQLLNGAELVVKDILLLTDSMLVGLNSSSKNPQYTDAELRGLIGTFSGVRAGLVNNLAAINSARSGLASSAEGLNRAELSGSGSGATLSGAQLKIALGSLRSAQAAYEKTLVRSPISGVVNALYIKRGDYVNPGTDAAIVANNRGLQIETAINQSDRDLLNIGDSVVINDTASGTISAIAGAVDPATGKIAVKISIADNSGLENGTVAKITLSTSKKVNTAVTPSIIIPLSAIKLLASGPVVFEVDGDSKLIAVPVELGPVTVDSVVVKSGLSADQRILADARGHRAGELVTVVTK